MTHGSDNKLVLIVDDTPTNVGVISCVLKGAYRTKVATNGEKALVLASAAEKPDLILLDVMMPGMDGYEVCRRLKANPVTRDIPVRMFITGASRATLCIMMDSFQVRKQVRSQKIEEITFTPNVPGKYRFYCPVNGMEGTLIVKELDIYYVRWLVVVVVIIASTMMLRSAARGE